MLSSKRSRRAKGGDDSAPELDRTDRRILGALAADGRLSWRDLAERVGLSVSPTLRRVKRLEVEGYITGYVAQLDEHRLAGGMSVFVMVTLANQSEDALSAFEAQISRLPEVMSCFLTTGGADYMLRVAVPSLNAYETFLMQGLTRIPGIAHIQSSFTLREVVSRSAAPRFA